MQLFYGADKLIEKPIWGMGNKSNDYGLGFYLTPNIEMAKLWASRFTEGGFCISYELNMEGLNVLHLESSEKEDVLKWISILVSNRFSKIDYEANEENISWLSNRFMPEIKEYDVIVGYRADDSYFAYSKDFVRNDLSLESLSMAMKAGKLGLQYVLKTEKAFSAIKMIAYEEVDHTDEYEVFRRKTNLEYKEIKKADDISNTFIRDIMRAKK